MISVVIPLYNEEENIPQLSRRLNEATKNWKDDVEVVLVNDGSSDRTEVMLNEIALADDKYQIIHFSRNFGHQPAISAGIKHAKGDAIIIMDGDLQLNGKKGLMLYTLSELNEKKDFLKRLPILHFIEFYMPFQILIFL